MKFAIGYQQPENGEAFADIVKDYQQHISEVYFPWPGQASGRAMLGTKRGFIDWTAQPQLEEELCEIRKMGIKLDLLFNANCYGGRAVSQQLEREVCSILEYLQELLGGVEILTTTSLAIARTVKNNFSDVETRASVNMRIGNIEAMKYVSGLYDSFYIQRDNQRDLEYVKKVKKWCDDNNKGLYMLANSGCLYCCPGQSFHDNMVAHDAEIDEMKNIEGWTPHVCWNHYKKKENWNAILKASWIRPEDLHHYDDIFPVVKLATRMHSHPRMVIAAYINRKFNGNLLDLFEPSFSPIFAPYLLDNKKFPQDWFDKTSKCARKCRIGNCNYCKKILEQVLRKSAIE